MSVQIQNYIRRFVSRILTYVELKAADFDYCLSICDLMMEKPSREACQVALRLVNREDFVNHAARVRLTSFCVNYCDERDIEDMLMQRINLVDEAGTGLGAY